jgi:diguanylate cyclase (GGDEF)-like protein
MQKAEALRISVKEMAVSHLSAMLPTCTISIGVATFPQHGQTADALLKTADEALYTAKREGRNRVVSGEAL